MRFQLNAFGHQIEVWRRTRVRSNVDATPLRHTPEPEITDGPYKEVWEALAKTSEQAERQYQRWRSRDPFPDIQPALMSLDDLISYVVETGMVFPFYPAEDLLRPASCAFRLMGPSLSWGPDGEEITQEIRFGDRFTLKSDSIAFLTLEPELRIPEYVAVRFNLRVRHVYRGLLVGTGPMIDPGFQGRLSVPLHNLTTRDYHFRGGEPIVFAEFTKLTPHRRWTLKPEGDTSPEIPRVTIDRVAPETPGRPSWRDVRDYVESAGNGEPVRSSIPANLHLASEAAQQAVRRATLVNLVAIVAIVLALLPIAFAFYQTWTWLADARDSTRIERAEVMHRLDSLERRIDALPTSDSTSRLAR